MYQLMRETDRLGEPIAATGGKYQSRRGLEAHPMAWRNKNRLYVRACADHRADALSVMPKPAKSSPLRANLVELADEWTLGTTHRGEIEKKSGMRSQSQAARMGNPLSVKDDDIGTARQERKNFKQNRRLAKAKKTGDIREKGFGLDPLLLDKPQLRETQ